MAEVLNLLPSEAVLNGSIGTNIGPDSYTVNLKTVESGWVNVRMSPIEFARLGASVTRTAGREAVLIEWLKLRAGELVGCTEGSPEKAELAALSELLDIYEAQK